MNEEEKKLKKVRREFLGHLPKATLSLLNLEANAYSRRILALRIFREVSIKSSSSLVLVLLSPTTVVGTLSRNKVHSLCNFAIVVHTAVANWYSAYTLP